MSLSSVSVQHNDRIDTYRMIFLYRLYTDSDCIVTALPITDYSNIILSYMIYKMFLSYMLT